MKYTLTCADCSMVSMENANTSPTCRRLECCVCMYVCACCVCALLFWNLLMKQFAFLASYSTSLFSNVQISQDELIICTAWLIQKLACKFQNFSPCFFRPLSILPFMRSSTGLTRYQHQTHQPNRWLPVIPIQCNAMQSNPTRPDPTRPDPTRPDPTRPDPTRPDPTRPNPTQPNPTQSNPIQSNPIQSNLQA